MSLLPFSFSGGRADLSRGGGDHQYVGLSSSEWEEKANEFRSSVEQRRTGAGTNACKYLSACPTWTEIV